MEREEGEATPPAERNRNNPRTRVVLALLLCGWALGNLCLNVGQEHEHSATRHVFPGLEYYYGGYGVAYFVYPDHYVPINAETMFNYLNVPALLSYEGAVWPREAPFVLGYAAGGRLFSTSFLPAVVQRFSFGTLNIHHAYLLVNVLLWLAAIWASFRLTGLLFGGRCAPFVAAGLVAAYPVLTLMFRSFKVQYAHSVFILVGICLFESRVKGLRFGKQALFFAAFLFISKFCGGADVLFLLALFGLVLSRHLPRRVTGADSLTHWGPTWTSLGAATLGFAVASLVSSHIRNQFGLRGLGGLYDLRAIFLTDNLAYVQALLTGENREAARFLGYPGDLFFTTALPKYLSSLFYSNPLLVALIVLAFVFQPRARALIFVAALIFLPGHAPEMLVAWRGSYGYGNAPTVLLAMVAVAGSLETWLSSSASWKRIAAWLLVGTTLSLFVVNRMDHLDNFYFSWGRLNAVEKIYVYHGEDLTEF